MSVLRAVWLVGRREVLTRVGSSAYRLSTIALVLLSVGGVVAAQALPGFFEDAPLRLGLTPAGAALQGELQAAAPLFDEELTFVAIEEGADLQVRMDADDLDAIVVGPERVVFASEADSTIVALVQRAAYDGALPERARALGLTVEEARSLLAPVAVRADILTPADEGESVEDFGGITTLTTIVLLMAISFYGNWVLVGVIEEKSNRVVEVLLATLEPWQLLTGKVLGIMSLALGQIVLTSAALVVTLLVVDEVSLPETGVLGFSMAIVWLVLGLLLYNFVYAAVGATVSRQEEASSASFPIMIPLFAGYFAGLFYVPANPDASLSRVLSLFPITAPLTMPSRVVAGGASIPEVALAMLGTAATIGLVIWLAARIYTGAILQTQRMNLVTAFRRARG